MLEPDEQLRPYCRDTAARSGGFGSLSPAPLALGIKMIRIQRPRAMISWHEPCLDPPWALLPLEPRVRPLVGHFTLAPNEGHLASATRESPQQHQSYESLFNNSATQA